MNALKNEEVTSSGECNQKELPFIEAAAILKEGSQYMLYRDCDLQVQGLDQKYRVRADPSAQEENETLLLEKTSTMKFEILKGDNDRTNLVTLVSALKDAVKKTPNTIEMKLICKFISPDDAGRESRDITYRAEVEKLSLPKSFPGESFYLTGFDGKNLFPRL
jgi:hypothetical protein